MFQELNIGKMGCTLGKRLNEHKAELRKHRGNSGIADRCLLCPNSWKPQFENTQIMGRETNINKIKISESLEMDRLG